MRQQSFTFCFKREFGTCCLYSVSVRRAMKPTKEDLSFLHFYQTRLHQKVTGLRYDSPMFHCLSQSSGLKYKSQVVTDHTQFCVNIDSNVTEGLGSKGFSFIFYAKIYVIYVIAKGLLDKRLSCHQHRNLLYEELRYLGNR